MGTEGRGGGAELAQNVLFPPRADFEPKGRRKNNRRRRRTINIDPLARRRRQIADHRSVEPAIQDQVTHEGLQSWTGTWVAVLGCCLLFAPFPNHSPASSLHRIIIIQSSTHGQLAQKICRFQRMGQIELATEFTDLTS